MFDLSRSFAKIKGPKRERGKVIWFYNLRKYPFFPGEILRTLYIIY